VNRSLSKKRGRAGFLMIFGKRKRMIERILVVEDEPLVAFDNEHFLRDAGYEVVATVDNVADALAYIGSEDISLVLTDMRLSGDGSGLDVARAARDRGLPVMFVTGSCPQEAPAVAVACLTKPYSPRDLRAAIEAVDARLRGKDVPRPPTGLVLFD